MDNYAFIILSVFTLIVFYLYSRFVEGMQKSDREYMKQVSAGRAELMELHFEGMKLAKDNGYALGHNDAIKMIQEYATTGKMPGMKPIQEKPVVPLDAELVCPVCFSGEYALDDFGLCKCAECGHTTSL